MNVADVSYGDLKRTIDDSELEALFSELSRIGVARFVGRINSGVIEPTLGYKCLERLVEAESKRPWPSRLSHLLTGHKDSFSQD